MLKVLLLSRPAMWLAKLGRRINAAQVRAVAAGVDWPVAVEVGATGVETLRLRPRQPYVLRGPLEIEPLPGAVQGQG